MLSAQQSAAASLIPDGVGATFTHSPENCDESVIYGKSLEQNDHECSTLLRFGQISRLPFALLNRGELMPHPSRLVTVPSMDDATLAPTGFSTLYVLEPVPNLKGKITWSSEAGPLRERLQTFLTEHGHPSEVITEDLVTPWGGRPRECRRHAVRAAARS